MDPIKCNVCGGALKKMGNLISGNSKFTKYECTQCSSMITKCDGICGGK